MNAYLSQFLATVHQEYFPEFPLWSLEDGRVVGEFIKIRLESHFLAASDEHGQWLGRVAGLNAIAPGGENIGSEAMARLTRVSETPVVLDRFIRCLHLLNYLREEHAEGRLILPLSTALLERVNQDHGRVFRQILQRLDLPTSSVGFLLPQALSGQHERLALLQRNYANHGFATFMALDQQYGEALLLRRLAQPLSPVQ